MKNIFIAGMLRSGTTLLEKVLHNHPNVSIASQPFPYLYINLKEKYYQKENSISRFPLDNYFLKGKKYLDDFYDFLKNHVIKKDQIINLLQKMESYSGQYTPEIMNVKYFDHLESGLFCEIYLDILKVISKIYSKQGLEYVGSKEVLCEEYMPFILSEVENSKGIIIIRDPRDVIASLNFGNYKNHVGKRRPTLFNIRNWRKSVAFALYLEKKSNFELIKYEDLTSNFYGILNNIASLLDIDDFEKGFFTEGIKDQQGNIWSGNSSFEDMNFINTNSIGKYKSILSVEVIEYIEVCCYPEMKYLEYEFEEINEFDDKLIKNFEEPFDIIRNDFEKNYSSKEEHIKQEIERYYKLNEIIDAVTAQNWYIFKTVYQKFRKKIKASY